MVKKSELRSNFEYWTKTLKLCGPWPRESVKTFSIEIFGSGRSFKIGLFVIGLYGFRGLVSCSYPFHSYKSAYQTLVRL